MFAGVWWAYPRFCWVFEASVDVFGLALHIVYVKKLDATAKLFKSAPKAAKDLRVAAQRKVRLIKRTIWWNQKNNASDSAGSSGSGA